MYKSKEISERLFSSAFEIFQKFLSFPTYLCIRLIYLADVLEPGISLSMEIMTLAVVYSIFKVLKLRYFFPSLYYSAFFMVSVTSILLRNIILALGFLFEIRCLMCIEVLFYNLSFVIHDNSCTETDTIFVRLT